MYSNPVKFYKPALVEPQHVDGLTIRNILLTNSPQWTLHPIYCDNVLISGVSITAEGRGAFEGSHTDGIDADSVRNVTIEDYYYCAGDDAIAIKSGPS